MSGFVYILESQVNHRFYIGSTQNITNRLNQHNSGSSKYTSNSRPWELVFSQEFDSTKTAKHIEHLLKKLKSRKIIQQIIVKRVVFLSKAGTINW